MMTLPQEPQQPEVHKLEQTDPPKKVTAWFEQAEVPSTGVSWYKVEHWASSQTIHQKFVPDLH